MSQQLLDQMSRYAQTLANPKRLEILLLLIDKGELNAGEIVKATDLTGPNLSQHLSLMKQCGLVTARRDGMNLVYGANGTVHAEVLSYIRAAVIHQLEQQRDLLQSACGVTV